MNNATTNFDILATSLSVIILIVQQNYFSNLYPVTSWDVSAKPFFSCTFRARFMSYCLWHVWYHHLLSIILLFLTIAHITRYLSWKATRAF